MGASGIRAMYEEIRFHEKVIAEFGVEKIGLVRDRMIRLKKEVRQLTKNNHDQLYGGVVLNGAGDFDYHWVKLFYPEVHWTPEEKKRYIEEHWQEAPNSQYDCTGAIFTTGIDIFDVPKGTVVYIRESRDV